MDGPSETTSLYFLLAESRSKDPLNDPLVIWLTGGPGCSGQIAAYTELGPYNFKYFPKGEKLDD